MYERSSFSASSIGFSASLSVVTIFKKNLGHSDRYYMILILICVSLTVKHVNIFPWAYWPFADLLWRSVYQILCSLVSWLSFCCWVVVLTLICVRFHLPFLLHRTSSQSALQLAWAGLLAFFYQIKGKVLSLSSFNVTLAFRFFLRCFLPL